MWNNHSEIENLLMSKCCVAEMGARIDRGRVGELVGVLSHLRSLDEILEELQPQFEAAIDQPVLVVQQELETGSPCTPVPLPHVKNSLTLGLIANRAIEQKPSTLVLPTSKSARYDDRHERWNSQGEDIQLSPFFNVYFNEPLELPWDRSDRHSYVHTGGPKKATLLYVGSNNVAEVFRDKRVLEGSPVITDGLLSGGDALQYLRGLRAIGGEGLLPEDFRTRCDERFDYIRTQVAELLINDGDPRDIVSYLPEAVEAGMTAQDTPIVHRAIRGVVPKEYVRELCERHGVDYE